MKFDKDAAVNRCWNFRRRILELSQQVPALHIAPAFSCMEIVDVLYNAIMKPDDIFIMSKGHGCVAQYVVLENLGILDKLELDLYCKPEGKLGAHPDYGVPGIEASTGSLGHGLGIAVGRALGEYLQSSRNTVYCLLSDGELQEGSTWEAIMMASKLSLNNLIALVDNNDFGGLERMPKKGFYPLVEKVCAFGWDSIKLNGHNSKDLYDAISNIPRDSPLLIVCDTVKGKGVPFMENEPIWHYRSPTPKEYEEAVKTLEFVK